MNRVHNHLALLKYLPLVLAGGTLLVSPALAQTNNDISLSDFRQAVLDSFKIVDAHSGSHFASTVPPIPDAVLEKWYAVVPNPRRFQAAAASLKANMEAGKIGPARAFSAAGLRPAMASPALASSVSPFVMTPSPLTPITVFPAPDFTPFAPIYPSGPSWGTLVGDLEGVSLMSSVDAQANACYVDAEANLSVIVSTFEGVKDAAEGICKLIPDETVVVLGEGATVPAQEVCFGINFILTGFTAGSEGFLDDCKAQDGFVNFAETDAIYNNSFKIYNLQLRLSIENGLLNNSTPFGLYEVPMAQGGELELVRSIVADTIAKMISLGLTETSANALLTAGDNYFNANNFKSAYKSYQQAYLAAAN